MTPAELADLYAASFPASRPWTEQEFTDLLEEPDVILVTRSLGFALGRVVAGEAELLVIAVHPEVRRTGVAKDLWAEFLASARARSAKEIFLEVAANNHPARALYRALGFGEVGRRKAYYQLAGGERIDALTLRLRSD